jgi:hypothetical protein
MKQNAEHGSRDTVTLGVGVGVGRVRREKYARISWRILIHTKSTSRRSTRPWTFLLKVSREHLAVSQAASVLL